MLFASLHKKFDKKFESMRNSMEDSLQTTQKLLETKLSEAEKSFDKKFQLTRGSQMSSQFFDRPTTQINCLLHKLLQMLTMRQFNIVCYRNKRVYKQKKSIK